MNFPDSSAIMPMFPLSSSKLFWGTTFAFSLYFLYVADSTTIQTPTPCPNPTTNPYDLLHIILNPNGTLTRLDKPPQTPPSSDPTLPTLVLSKDLTFDRSKNTYVRIFLPRKALDRDFSKKNKLPLVVFFHGGGFILLSAASTIFHNFCANLASDVGVVVASVEYRLAPEHRLPAAYDDAMEALHWIRTNPDDWLSRYADISNSYLMGSSAGGNIAYYAGLRAAAEVDHLRPLKIGGLILVQPFFGGTQRTASELRLMNDSHLPLCGTDLLWDLSLPVGVTRDQKYCNPTTGDGPKQIEKIRRVRWRVLVTGCDGDPLVDRQKELAKVMKEKGVHAVSHFTKGDYHGIQDRDPVKAKQLYGVVKTFISSVQSQETPIMEDNK